MTNFTDVLQEKIDELEEDKERLDEEKERIDEKIELLVELMEGEGDKKEAKAPAKRKAGRPKGSKKKRGKKGMSAHAPKDELYEEAMKQLANSEEGATSKELQEKLTKNFNPTPRPERSLGAGIIAGTKKEVLEEQGKRKTHATVSVDESDLEDD